eukprot:TRINITY_DN103588_c0_g1_i1.p2 TRINITY_DN103588_c0_g1~~TRINITY_DN103588_c0_g1_i1.p2  ORF type:complete len:208 (-),score=17.85 TRINITY_DN103588_c0_g1_i1:1776-2399(-)
MPVICIGPVCIPWAVVWPLIWFMIKPIWNRLPPAVQQRILAVINPMVQAYESLLDKILPAKWRKKKQKKQETSKSNPAEADTFHEEIQTRIQDGGLLSVSTEAHWDTVQRTTAMHGMDILAMFSAPWCKPCQAVKPIFTEKSEDGTNRKKALFVYVNVDDADEVVEKCDAATAIPLFQHWKGGEKKGSMTGGHAEKLKTFLDGALGK